MSLAAWTAALDEFEATLRAHRDVLTGKAQRPETFRPPEGLGPLPMELLPRANELAQTCAQLTTELQLASDRARARIAQSLPPQTPAGPAFLSTHA